jgi:hypothetical protein
LAITLTVAAIAVAGVATAGATAYSASQSASAAKDQVSAAQNATQLQAAEFNVEQQNEQPWLAAGNSALQTLIQGSAPGGQFNQQFQYGAAQYTASPGFNAATTAGNQQIQDQAAAEGRSLSPATLQAEGQYTANAALQDFTQQEGIAYNQFQNQENTALGEQETLAGFGEQAVGNINQAGQTAATNEGNLAIDIGNAQATGALGQAQAVSSGVGSVNQGLQSYLNAQYYNNLFLNSQGETTAAQATATSMLPQTYASLGSPTQALAQQQASGLSAQDW